MNFTQFMDTFATEIDGQFSEYDKTKSVIIVPVDDFRYQTVVGILHHSERYDKSIIEFSSKVCPFTEEVNLKSLMEQNTKFCHGKFSIVDEFIKVEGSAFVDSATEKQLKEIILEVAHLADEWELTLTGMDVH